jgi:hypothetical protein
MDLYYFQSIVAFLFGQKMMVKTKTAVRGSRKLIEFVLSRGPFSTLHLACAAVSMSHLIVLLLMGSKA